MEAAKARREPSQQQPGLKEVKMIVKNAKTVAQRYKRRCWWISEEDLRQEAVLQQLDAYRRFDPSAGPPLEGYLFRVAIYAARRVLLKASAPVSASHRLDVLIGLYREPIEEDSAGYAIDTHDALFARQVRDRLVRCLGEDRAKFAFAMIVEGWGVREVAKANGVCSAEVRRELTDAQGLLSRDLDLHSLWKEGI